MPYMLHQTSKVMEIAEREWGVAPTIQFTKFTSCIGILAKIVSQGQVIGIHLTLKSATSDTFEKANIPLITDILTQQKYDSKSVMIVGQISVWENEILEVYQSLKDTLQPSNLYPFGDGIYGAKISNGEIEITY